MGKVEKTRFERNWTNFVNGLFTLLGKAQPKWWYETHPVEFDPKGVFTFRPDGESQKNAFWTQYDDLRTPGFLRCLEKPSQNGGRKPTSWNSIPRVFLRFAAMGKVEKTRFERNWTTFVNPAFWAACKSPAKMVVRNPPRGTRSQGCFFVSPRWEKSKKRVLNVIGRPSSTQVFGLLAKAQPKWWYETHLVEFDPKNVFSFRPDGESRKNAFWTQLDDLCLPDFLRCLKKPSQNGGMKPTSWYSIPRVFFRFAPMGKVEKTRFERNWTTFVCAALKSPAKMVVWNPPRRIRSQGCLFVSPRSGKSKKLVLNAIGRPSPTRLFTLLAKALPKWWYETHFVEFDPKNVFSFRPDGESRKNAFWTQLDDLRQPAFYAAWKSPAKMVVWNPPRRIRSQGCFFVSPRWGKSKKRVLNAIGRSSYTRLFALLPKAQPKWWYETHLVGFDPKVVFSFRPDGESRKNAFSTQLDDLRQPAFYAAWKSPAKMVVWNPPRRIRSQGFFFVSPRWGKSKKRVLNAIGRPSTTGFLRCLEKPSQNGGMKPTS